MRQRYKCQWITFEPSSSTPAASRPQGAGGRFADSYEPSFSYRTMEAVARLVRRAGAELDTLDEDRITLFGRPGPRLRTLVVELETLLGPRQREPGGTVRRIYVW